MKKLFSFLFLAVFLMLRGPGFAIACDFCLLSQGISPLQTLTGAGLRINGRYTFNDVIYRGTEKLSNPGDKEKFFTTEFTGFHGVTEDLMLLTVVPVKETSQTGELDRDTMTLDTSKKGEQKGLGDVAVMGRYSFYRRHTLDSTTDVAGVLGIKFPTGKTDGRTEDGTDFLDSHLQLGTGSYDYLVGLSLSHSVQRFSISANLLGTFTSNGRDGNMRHQFGNTLNYDVNAKYRVYPADLGQTGPQFFLALGLNGEVTGREKNDGVTDPNSGGDTTYISPGVQVVFAPHWIAELSYQQAIYHNLYGTQLGTDYRATGGVTYLF